MSVYDLTALYIRIDECPKDTLLIDHFTDLSVFKEFQVCDENRIKIAILSGDVDSPFVRIKERETMIRAIFEYLCIDIHKDQKFFDNVVSYKDELTTFAWLRYIQILHETDFTDWNLAKRDYDFFILQSNEPKGVNENDMAYYKRRNETRERVKDLGKEVRNIESKLFPDSKAAREAALADSKRKVKLYCEAYAEAYTYK